MSKAKQWRSILEAWWRWQTQNRLLAACDRQPPAFVSGWEHISESRGSIKTVVPLPSPLWLRRKAHRSHRFLRGRFFLPSNSRLEQGVLVGGLWSEGWGGRIAANVAFCDKKLRLKQGCSKSTGDRCQETRQLRSLLPPPSAGTLGFFSSFWLGNYSPCQWAKALALISSGQPCLKFCHHPEILRAIETPQLCLLLSRAAKSLSR